MNNSSNNSSSSSNNNLFFKANVSTNNLKYPQRGASTSVHAASSLQGKPRQYFTNNGSSRINSHSPAAAATFNWKHRTHGYLELNNSFRAISQEKGHQAAVGDQQQQMNNFQLNPIEPHRPKSTLSRENLMQLW